MTRIRSTDSSRVDDRRGQGGGMGGLGFPGLGGGGGMGLPMKGGGGLLGLLIMAAIIFLPRLLGNNSNQLAEQGGGTESQGEVCSTDLEQTLCGANEDVQDYWDGAYPAAFGGSYDDTKMVFFSGSTNTGCGYASSETGPFYCPADRLVYFDLDFLVQLQNQFGATGDLAAQYIVAHEFGHHVQNLTGQNQPPSDFRGDENEWSVLVELQADCYAGAWARDAAGRTNEQGLPLFESETEINEAINAAGAVGDDRIQLQTQGRTNPETYTHGTSEQRVAAFSEGYNTGDPTACQPREWLS